jgi:hypothetical protein
MICLFIAFALNSYEDTLAHHYDVSIFAELGHDSYWYPDWTRKYESLDPLVRKGWWIFDYPAWIYDGWHLIKIFRYLFYFYSLWFIFIIHTEKENLFKLHWKLLGSYLIFQYLVHWLFYNNLLLNK